jgi:CubicO group peptidase (beta-lactamase class C family)
MGKLDDQVDAVFADVNRPQHPGAALLVIDRGERLFSKCYGIADLKTERPITTDTSFYLASISKQFTAMAIMMLAEQGKLTFDDRLLTFLPRFPSWGAEITLRHLLHHTSGLPLYHRFFASDEFDGLTSETMLERIMTASGPDFPAGTKYDYCNTGYVVLAMITAIVSGRSFAELLKTKVFDPLGMEHTVVYDASRPMRHKLAQAYMEANGQFTPWDYPLLTVGDGGIFSTLDDLFLWDQALNTERLVPRAALQRAFTSGTTNDGTSVGYGFGWYTNVFTGRRHAAHGGTLGAYSNYIIRFLDDQCTIIVLTNRGPIEPVWKPGGILGPRPRAHRVAEILFSG